MNGKSYTDFSDLENWDEAEVVDTQPTEAQITARTITGNDRAVTEQRGEYRCTRCQGTGQMRVFRRGMGWGQAGELRQCVPCKGRGWFKTSPAERRKAKQQRVDRKVAKADANWLAFATAHEAESQWMVKNPGFEFAVSMMQAVRKYGSLTDGQMAAVRKCLAREVERAKAKADRPTFAFPRIVEALTHARTVGKLKYPKMRLATEGGQKVVLGLAGDRAREPGSVNVTDGGPYGDNVWFGRISTDGTFAPSRSSDDDVVALLTEVNEDPLEAAKVQGQRTGNCYCCGRELTNAVSVELGIGPICREKWGL